MTPPTVEPETGNAGEGKVMGQPRSTRYDAVVIGAGLIGLASARRAAEHGLSVLVVDRCAEPGGGASGVAAGMLAPVTEADFGEQALLQVNLAARERWPAFAAGLEERTGLSTGYRETGALVVAADRDDAEELRRLHEFQRSLGLDAQWLSPTRCRELEPGLSPRIAGGILASQDAQADPRAVLVALRRAFEAAGGELLLGVEAEAIEIDSEPEGAASSETVRGLDTHLDGVDRSSVAVSGVRTSIGVIACEQVVLAAGAWSPALATAGGGPPVRPVKGQILELRVRDGLPEPCVRVVRSPRCYLLSRGDGRVVLGATMEEQGFDTTVTADGVFRLIEAAYALLPEVSELELVAARAGLRPGTPDNTPLIGPGKPDGLVWAAGHWRNGVLLAPLTGDAIGGLLAGEPLPGELAPFTPGRFAREAAPA
jgi:glycine oxidase